MWHCGGGLWRCQGWIALWKLTEKTAKGTDEESERQMQAVVAGCPYNPRKSVYRRPKERELKWVRWEITTSESGALLNLSDTEHGMTLSFVYVLFVTCPLPIRMVTREHHSSWHFFSLFRFTVSFHSLSYGWFIWVENSAGSCCKKVVTVTGKGQQPLGFECQQHDFVQLISSILLQRSYRSGCFSHVPTKNYNFWLFLT